MKTRDDYVDFVRGVGILLVIFGHACVCLQKPVFGFHMPLFFFLSGLFLSKYLTIPFREVFHKALRKTFFPFVIFFFVGLVSYLLQDDWTISWVEFVDGIWTGHPKVNPSLWFLTSLFFSTLLAVVLLKKVPRGGGGGGYALLLGVAIMFNFIPHRIRHHFPLMICSWPYAAAFIMAGHQSSSLLAHIRQRGNQFILGGLGCLLICGELLLSICWPMSSMSFDYCFIGPFLTTSVLGIAGTLLASIVLVKVLPVFIRRIVCFMGENSLYFFCLDLVVLRWHRKLLVPGSTPAQQLFLFLCQLVVLFVLVRLISCVVARRKQIDSLQ